MRSDKKSPVAIWEWVPDRDYREKLRKAFAIIFSADVSDSGSLAFDETGILEQDENAAKH